MKNAILLLVGLFFSFSSLHAKHIIGGDVSYEVEDFDSSTSTVSIIFTLYRDIFSGGANFDVTSTIGIYGYSNNGYQYLTSLSASVGEIEQYDSSVFGCPGFDYETGSYAYTYTFPRGQYEHFSIGYQRCCRQDDLGNIVNPSETGIALELILYDQVLGIAGSGPVPNKVFPSFSEVGLDVEYDLSASSSLDIRYTLVAPGAAGGTDGVVAGDPTSCSGITPNPQVCPPPFESIEFLSSTAPYGEGNMIELDIDSGMLTASISTAGKVLLGIQMARLDADDNVLSINPQQFVGVYSNCIVSVNEENETSIILYPNPIIDNVYVSEDLLYFFIYNIDGVLIKEMTDVAKGKKIFLGDLSAGIYLAKGKTITGKQITEKLVIK